MSKIKLNIPLFEAYSKGYLSEADKFLSPTEVDSLMMGVLLIPYMQAVRFLTDYLEGDVYYKTSFEGHNLQRTRAQIQLLKEIEAEYETLKGIIEKVHNQIRNKVSLLQ
ncbi:N-acetylhexosamine 1-kinase [compost metagenome]